MRRGLPAIGLLLALAMNLAWSAEASAHAALTGSEPTDGAILDVAPPRFVLRFNEPVSPLRLSLVAPGGDVEPLAGATWTDDGLVVPLPTPLIRGTHVLSWRVVSEDGHPIGGSVVFSLGRPSTTGGQLYGEAPGLRLVIWMLRAALFLVLFVGVGGVAFASWAAAGRATGWAESVVARALWLVPPIAVLSLGALGLDALGVPWSALFTLAPWTTGFGITYGLTAALSAGAAFLALAARSPRSRHKAWLAGCAILAVGAAFAASGHASTAAPQMVSRPAVAIHAMCLAIWIGSLVPLASLVSSRDPGAVPTLRRFSRLIPWVVGLLIASGILIACLQLRSPADLVATPYGCVLAAKLVLVSALLALAAYNRYGLTRRVTAADRAAGMRLVRVVAVELVIAIAILGTVALWRFTPPPRVLAAVPPAVSVHLHGGNAMALASVSPGRIGPNTVTVVMPGASQPKEIALSLWESEGVIEPIRQAMVYAHGTWKASGLYVPRRGTWMLRLDVLVDDFQSLRLEGRLDVEP